MSTRPMTQERLDAIQGRAGEVTTLRSASFNDWQELALHLSECVDDLLAEVERLRALATVDDAKIERVARNLANLEVGEAWPTTRELGGVPRSGRDEEYRSAMREWAQKVINISLGEDEDEWI